MTKLLMPQMYVLHKTHTTLDATTRHTIYINGILHSTTTLLCDPTSSMGFLQDQCSNSHQMPALAVHLFRHFTRSPAVAELASINTALWLNDNPAKVSEQV